VRGGQSSRSVHVVDVATIVAPQRTIGVVPVEEHHCAAISGGGGLTDRADRAVGDPLVQRRPVHDDWVVSEVDQRVDVEDADQRQVHPWEGAGDGTQQPAAGTRAEDLTLGDAPPHLGHLPHRVCPLPTARARRQRSSEG